MPRTYGTTTERGYGSKHQKLRAQWKPHVDAGEVDCLEIICLEQLDGYGRAIDPGTPWNLAHDRTTGGYLGPAHERCNKSEGARHKQQIEAGNAPPPQRQPGSTANRWQL